MNQGSLECKALLEALHPNIKVVPHSPTLAALKWSHHQKFVVADSKVCVFGGLDVTYGRWDNRNHNLVDTERNLLNGLDYYIPSLGFAPVSCAASLDRPTRCCCVTVTGLQVWDPAEDGEKTALEKVSNACESN